jgi:hypothetical protein
MNDHNFPVLAVVLAASSLAAEQPHPRHSDTDESLDIREQLS